MKYPIAERFFAPQGEGLYTGTPMAFIRFIGCSVGQKVCTHCDTDFEVMNKDLGGGLFSPEELVEWVGAYHHVCITGGEPLDRDIYPLFKALADRMCHIETSGTRSIPTWMRTESISENPRLWICVSPKPGYLIDAIGYANEIKVILGGLGDGPGWPTIDDAIRWEDSRNVPVYLQPRNYKKLPNDMAMEEVLFLVDKHPQLRLSAQLHKYLRTR